MTEYIEARKAQIFVRHVQNHLDNHETAANFYTERRKIPNGQVGCKICEKGIEQIYKEENLP